MVFLLIQINKQIITSVFNELLNTIQYLLSLAVALSFLSVVEAAATYRGLSVEVYSVLVVVEACFV